MELARLALVGSGWYWLGWNRARLAVIVAHRIVQRQHCFRAETLKVSRLWGIPEVCSGAACSVERLVLVLCERERTHLEGV